MMDFSVLASVLLQIKTSFTNSSKIPAYHEDTGSEKDNKLPTLFWGVMLQTSLFERFSDILTDNPDLVPNTELHSTLVFIGRKVNDQREEKYDGIKNKRCQIVIDRYGLSDDALCLGVKTIRFESCENVPSDSICQHITMALRQGTYAKDSYLALNTNSVTLDKEIVLAGVITRYV
jgi:hypothetical protein